MNIDRLHITIADLIDGYEERGDEGIEGIVAYGGKLDVRPAYQREFIYDNKDRDEVIRSVMKGFPINVMYWYKIDDDHYELMDGQQRTISICRYAACKDSDDKKPYEQCYTVDGKFFFNLTPDKQEAIRRYDKIDVFICTGTQSEVLDWFRVINKAGKILFEQELLNTSFIGAWLSDAKLYFSKPKCTAYNIGKNYLTGAAIRQDYLETALSWIVDRDGVKDIQEYMAIHQFDENASPLKQYFRKVIDWINQTFPNYRPKMKGVEWGILYNKHKDDELDPDKLEKQIKELMIDDDVTNKQGIYYYVLGEPEKHLSIRAFTEAQRIAAYERQNGLCYKCGDHFDIGEMHADHIKPWSKGGRTIPENCKMLCANCNRLKSDV